MNLPKKDQKYHHIIPKLLVGGREGSSVHRHWTDTSKQKNPKIQSLLNFPHFVFQ